MKIASPSLRRRLREQAGIGLVEVMVSALLVVVLTLAVLGGMQGASNASGASKAKAVAANLAQQDQERLHSLRPSEIMGLDQTQRVDADSGDGSTVAYTVQSKGEYFLAPTSSAGCTGGKKDEELRIKTTVDWPGRRGTSPVTIESLIAPPLDASTPTQGSAVVKVLKFDGVTPVPGLQITLTGPTGVAEVTGIEGCAYFGNLPVGTYTGTFGSTWTGWADPGGNQVVTFTLTVTSESTASIDRLYDTTAKEITVETWTHAKPSGGTEATLKKRPELVSFAHASAPGGKYSVAPADSTTLLVQGRNLPDYGSPYTVYTGSCARNRLDLSPGGWAGGELDKLGTTYVRTVVADGSKTIKVFEPSFNVKILYDNVGYPGIKVTFEQTDAGCGGTLIERRTGPGGRVAVGDGAMPFGTYDICVWYPDTTKVLPCKSAKNDKFDGKPVDFKFD